jgi:hypothetical protein
VVDTAATAAGRCLITLASVNHYNFSLLPNTHSLLNFVSATRRTCMSCGPILLPNIHSLHLIYSLLSCLVVSAIRCYCTSCRIDFASKHSLFAFNYISILVVSAIRCYCTSCRPIRCQVHLQRRYRMTAGGTVAATAKGMAVAVDIARHVAALCALKSTLRSGAPFQSAKM